MAKQKKELKPEHKIFVQHYVIDWNATKAYQKVYPDSTYEAAMSSACDLLRNPNIKEYIKHVQENIEKYCGISQQKVLNEYMKIAFSSIADLHNSWVDRKLFEELTPELKACISEIQSRTRRIMVGDEPAEVEEIKIKLFDKQRALENICKMLGYNEPDKINILGQKIEIVISDEIKEWL